MNYLEPHIIIVDDKKNEIQGIIDYYNTKGLGCKFFNADLFEGDPKPTKHYSDVTLIFLDLYYSESDSSFDVELCSSWIRSLIPEKSFYLLVFWTKDPANVNAILEKLLSINRVPFKYLSKNKTEYQTSNLAKYDFQKLCDDLNREVESIPALYEIHTWKKSVVSAANEVIGNLTKDPTTSTVTNKIKKIIIGHGGEAVKTSTDNFRKRTILFDALDSVLISNTKKRINDNPISTINNENLYDLNNYNDTSIDKELNSWFHFKLDKHIPPELITAGLICKFKEDQWKSMYSIHDDQKVSDFIKKQTDGQKEIASIALLISRPCDLAQNKFGKNLKLLSGLMITNPIRKENAKKAFSGATQPDSIKLYDHLYLDEKRDDITLLFDFRYNFSVPENIFKDNFDNLIIFNKELLSELQVEYSNYSSRLGITQII